MGRTKKRVILGLSAVVLATAVVLVLRHRNSPRTRVEWEDLRGPVFSLWATMIKGNEEVFLPFFTRRRGSYDVRDIRALLTRMEPSEWEEMYAVASGEVSSASRRDALLLLSSLQLFMKWKIPGETKVGIAQGLWRDLGTWEDPYFLPVVLGFLRGGGYETIPEATACNLLERFRNGQTVRPLAEMSAERGWDLLHALLRGCLVEKRRTQVVSQRTAIEYYTKEELLGFRDRVSEDPDLAMALDEVIAMHDTYPVLDPAAGQQEEEESP